MEGRKRCEYNQVWRVGKRTDGIQGRIIEMVGKKADKENRKT